MDSKSKMNANEAADVEKMFPVKLLKNYMPAGGGANKKAGIHYEIIEAVESQFPGVYQEHKLWAGTIVKLPRAEAMGLIDHKVTELITTRDANDRLMSKTITRRMPLAERADDYQV
jgi:hypothetical protein